MNSSGWPNEPEHRLRGGRASNKEGVVAWSATLALHTKKTTLQAKKTNKVIKAKANKARDKSARAGRSKRTTTSGHKAKCLATVSTASTAAAEEEASDTASNTEPKHYKLGKQASGGITVATRRGFFRF